MRLTLCAAAVLMVTSALLAQPAPGKKGEHYPAPGKTNDLKRELLWDSQCEEPAGQGLAFSGQSQVADDGQPHTRIKVDGEWKPIVEELRKANPLRKQHDELWVLRNRLKNAATNARFVFFEGRPEADEKAYLAKEVNPELAKLAEDMKLLFEQLKGWDSSKAMLSYAAGQVRISVAMYSSGRMAITPIIGRVTPEILAALRQAQQQLELAAEALDAEPAPRVCSPIVYDATNKLYVLFGGDHFDYLTNDTWVFDPAKRQWFQRHPAGAPTPRGDHKLTATGDGRITLAGGYTYTSSTDYSGSVVKQYCHVGDGEWVYDIAKNTWASTSGATTQPADSRVYRTGAYLPEHFMEGPKPDAAANEAKLKALPANTWTNMHVPHYLFLNRDWGTAALDTDRDMIIYWSGGHCVHSGSDVPHYHLATNRWELPFPIEMPLGFISASGVGVGGRNFNGRPWMSNHTDNCYAYDSGLKKLVVVGRNNLKLDNYTYLYDPDLGDWTERFKVSDGMNVANMEVNVRATPKGVVAWTHDPSRLWLLNRSPLKWEPIKFDAGEVKLPAPMVDNCGLVYDPKRDRVLIVHKFYGEKSLFNGKIYALDMKTYKLTELTPAGSDKVSTLFNGGQLRESFYDPASDLFLWAAWLPGGERMLGYDPTGNRWVSVKVKGPAPFDVSTGMVFDPKRKLVWLVHGSSQAGEMFVLRFDAAQADVQPMGAAGKSD